MFGNSKEEKEVAFDRHIETIVQVVESVDLRKIAVSSNHCITI